MTVCKGDLTGFYRDLTGVGSALRGRKMPVWPSKLVSGGLEAAGAGIWEPALFASLILQSAFRAGCILSCDLRFRGIVVIDPL